MYSILLSMVPLLGITVLTSEGPRPRQESAGTAAFSANRPVAPHTTAGTPLRGPGGARRGTRHAVASHAATVGRSCEAELDAMAGAMAGYWAADDAQASCGGCVGGAVDSLMALADLMDSASRFSACTAVS